MMKYFSLTSLRAAGLSFSLLFASINFFEADPTDDFSFSLGQLARKDVYRVMPVRQVSELLADRLDWMPKSQIPRFAQHIVDLCGLHRFDPAFILSLIEVESRFKVRAISASGAIGLMQIMPSTATHVVHHLKLSLSGQEQFSLQDLRRKEISTRILSEPFVNTAVGIAYLAWLREHSPGKSAYHLLAAYNVGPGRLKALLSRNNIKDTKKYFLAIRRGIPTMRFYQQKLVSKKRTSSIAKI